MTDPMDATLPPSPEGGWSCSLTRVEGAVVNHVRQGYLVHPSGVFDARGAYVPQAVQWRGRPLMVPPPLPEAPEALPGRWLWGGVLMEHFGHFLTESTGRLWALDALEGPLDGIVYLPEKGFGGELPLALKSYQRLFLDLLGIDLPVRILTRATRIETLEVPGPGFGIGPMIAGSAPFRQFIQTRLAPDVAASGGERLYISRSGLEVALGGILGERRLEDYLQEAGYEIYHPQNHSLPDQIARYRAAREVISIDGSALHLLGLVMPPGQRVAMIKRRKGPASQGFVTQLASFGGQPPLVIDVIERNWIRSDRKHADNFSFGELNFRKLGNRLAGAGFLPEGTRWDGLPRRKVAASVAWIEKKLSKKGLTFQPDIPLERAPA